LAAAAKYEGADMKQLSDVGAQLDDYLAQFQARLRHLHLARAAAAIAVACLLLTCVGVYFAVQRGFADSIVYATRAVLLVAVVTLSILLLVQPWRRIARQPASDIERLAPDFGGRVATWSGMSDAYNPLRVLLAEDTLALAEKQPIEQQIKRWTLGLPSAVAALAAGLLLWLAVAGPGLYGYGVRHVWAGWAVKGLLPAQGILVVPGNQAVRRGGAVPIVANAHGFNPANATFHARVGSHAWQDVAMTRSPRGFEFTLLAVREPTQYYVSAAGINSARYDVAVVEVPNVENLKLAYRYPSWTRLKPVTQDPGGDVSAVTGTTVLLEVTTDRPVGAGLLIMNGKDAPLTGAGTTAKASFTVNSDGRYYLAARVGSETVRLTDDYLITLQPDLKPEIKIVKPGRDWTASNIEEVTQHVQASDDFALESVQLHYAINGGAWQALSLGAKGGAVVDATHTLMLENLRSAAEDRSLAAGDLISYYATARDRAQSTQTDMYFVEVRPFDRKYTQAQQQGGAGGAAGGNDEQQISKRQKEILVSTWNLIRQKQATAPDKQVVAAGGVSSARAVRDNSVLLADVQEKLAAQAQSLAQRAQSRELTGADEQIKSFISLMQDASKAMLPAQQRLAAVDLEKAIQPEQLALQYLLRAEAVYNDMQVSMQQGGAGSGGGAQSGRDLAELYELEMDLEKNQYEAANSASPEQAGEQADEISKQLQELARRQEQLANDARRAQPLTDAQRWQQEALKREAEQLQQQLSQLQQGQAGRQLQQAISAMNRASEAMRNNTDPTQQREALQRATGEAGRQLGSVSQQLAQQRRESMRSQLSALSEQAEANYARQAALEEQLQESASAAANARTRTDSSAGLNAEQRKRLAERKRALSGTVQKLEQDLSAAARRWRNESPTQAESATQAGQMLAQGQIQNQLTQSAQYIERGLAAFVVPRESAVTDTLRDVRDELRAAQAGSQGATEAQRNNRALQAALTRVQQLRQQVQQLANAQATGQQGQQTGGATPAGIQREIGNAVRQVGGVAPLLRGQGAGAKAAEQVSDLARQLQSVNLGGRGEQLTRQLNTSLTLLEQLEQKLSQTARGTNKQSVRTAVNEPVADSYQDAVAEYYRQLSKD
jgi:hypothetical protein